MKNIKVIEANLKFDMNFTAPQAQLNEEQLSKIFGGLSDAGCKCKKQEFIDCLCHNGGTLVDR